MDGKARVFKLNGDFSTLIALVPFISGGFSALAVQADARADLGFAHGHNGIGFTRLRGR